VLVPVVKVRLVPVGVRQPRMPVLVRVACSRRKAFVMVVVMAVVVTMRMHVDEILMSMFVCVPIAE